MTVLEVLKAATEYLARQGVESPRLNAEHLLAHTLGKPKRIDLYLDFERPLGEAERAPLRDLVKRRSDGIPLQHLLGTVDFLGHLYVSDKRALIPRPETEQLVELVLGLVPDAPLRILDVGTGSGVIALSLARERTQASVVACDLSSDALALARENAVRLGLSERVAFVECDLLSGVDGPFHGIVANLPYIPSPAIAHLSREVQHDPLMALDGGAKGLDIIIRLVSAATSHLMPGGFVALEIGHDQAVLVREIFLENNYRDISLHADYQGVQRFVIARHG